jgi:DNA polymerase III epsilon subunit-like protein
VRIFFDTEFTSLKQGAALISIGLVDQAGSEFYAELSDTYKVGDCSDFCRTAVLPQLEGAAAQKTLEEVRVSLAEWLLGRGTDAVLVCDSPRDVAQLQRLFPCGLPPNVTCEVVGWWGNLRRRFLNRGRRLHTRLGLRVHHALDDARINQLVLSRMTNQAGAVLQAAREWHTLGEEGERLLGPRGWALFRSYGRMMSGPHSGSYVSALPVDDIRRLLTALAAGERIPVHLMHRHRGGNYESSRLSLTAGHLVMHYPDRSEPAE